ncbi:MAG TPA: hypothetical protein VN841_29240 [Bryobacteraceae bacterium]|nr:hypothetical protein [Bryobacteraceae bacterium]
MPDAIGRIVVPTPAASGLTFPLTPDFGFGMTRPWPVIVHRFGELATKAEQRFQVGFGPRKFNFRREKLSYPDKINLLAFFEQVQGSYQSFLYHAPNADGTTTDYQVIFETAPLTIDELSNGCRVGINFIECPDPSAAPIYSVLTTDLRFPSAASGLAAALLSQVQVVIPLVHIRVREAAVPDIYLSDRRCTVGVQLYLPRVLDLGEPGSDVIISQDINGTADNVQFVFGNADRTMTRLANDTDLLWASIDLTLYFPGPKVLLQLWKGFVRSFVSDGSPKFSMQCSDGLYQVTQQYPVNVISRTCWKTFNDGLNCPWSTASGVGDGTQCDYYFDSPNGCEAHGMTTFFGGHPAQPQGVNIKDNSTGVFGFGRNTVTATSIVSDTMWGQALPEIWCNQRGNPLFAFMVNALIAAVRDEGDAFDVLGIVGAGPIGLFTGMGLATNADGYTYVVAPMADGFPPEGFTVNIPNDTYHINVPNLGLREVNGDDPVAVPGTPVGGGMLASPSDSFSLGQNPIATNGALPPLGQIYGPQMAAGTAFVELRYQKPSGILPTTPDQHSMTVPIAMGLTGLTWTGGLALNRVPVQGLTNPFWIAVNSYLRCLGLQNATSDVQLGTFVLDSLYVGDGSGTAEIADTLVSALVGGGSEVQFQFQGTVAQQKPFRDWLTEILACALGFYTFEFGKLKLGCRINASAVAAYTPGNMLFQSLTLKPIQARFEHLIVDFADVAYQFQADTAEYQDKSYAAYMGRPNAPRTARQHVVGCSTLSQGLRIAATRVREEIGGVNPTEWAAARTATWKSTIMALDGEAGDVVSITHADVPNGQAKFRIRSFRLFKDWSVQLEGQTVTDSMYDLDAGPKPTSVTPAPLPAMNWPVPLGEWAPYQVQAAAADALYPSEWTFDLAQGYSTLADGTVKAGLNATGKLPINEYLPGCGAPNIASGQVTQSTTGGSIPGGVTLRIAICATDALSNCSPPSPIVLVQVPSGTNTNKITIGGIVWPPVSGLTGYVVFASTADDLIGAQPSDSASVIFGNAPGSLPASVTIKGPLMRSIWALPNAHLTNVMVSVKHLVHGGPVGSPVDSVSGNVIVASETIDSAGTDNWAGRALAIIGRPGASAPFAHFNITAFNPANGHFTLDRAADAAGVQAGDAFVVCFKGYDNSANPLQIGDTGLANATNPTPHAGETPNDPNRKGNIVRVIKGTNRGATAKIVSNTATAYTLDRALPIDATSVWIVESPSWEYSAPSSQIQNANVGVSTVLSVPTQNFQNTPLLVGGFCVDDTGATSDEADAVLRMVYVFGQASGIVVAGSGAPYSDAVANSYGANYALFRKDPASGNWQQSVSVSGGSRVWTPLGSGGGGGGSFAPGSNPLSIVSNSVAIDLDIGLFCELTLSQSAQVTIQNPTGAGSSTSGSAESWMILTITTDGTAGRPSPAWGTAYGSDVAAVTLSGMANSASCLILVLNRLDSKWHLACQPIIG